MHIYPAIDIRGGQCVRLVQGDYARETVFSADPVAMAQQWVAQGADRLHLVDLDGAKSGHPVNSAVIQRIVQSVTVPVQLGGGIRTRDDLALVFDSGVHWAVLGTQALADPDFVRDAALQSPHKIVLGLDARDGLVATEGWLATSTTQATELAKRLEDAPLFAVVYTDIARDGTLTGPNLSALDAMIAATRLPVIASGGVSQASDISDLAQHHAFGVIIGRALYDGAVTLTDALRLAK